MKIERIGVLLFIFAIMIIAAPQHSLGISSIEEHESTGPSLNQLPTLPSSQAQFVNASVTEVSRNISISLSAVVELEDMITLKIYDDVTTISYVNYSIPTAFAQYVQDVNIKSKFDSSIDLDSANNTRDYGVYQGTDVTTYSIDIRENGLPANDSLSAVYLQVKMYAINSISFTANTTGSQRGEVMVPLVPMFGNLNVSNALISVDSNGGSKVSFQTSEMGKFTNAEDQTMPTASASNKLTYSNMSREAYSENMGMIDGDVAKLVFLTITPQDNQTPVGTQVPTPQEISKATRTVRIDPWGKVFVSEQIVIKNLGAPEGPVDNKLVNSNLIGTYKLAFSSKALLTDVSDDMGRLETGNRDSNGNPKTSASITNGKQEILIYFRDPIHGGQTYTLNFKYVYNASQILNIEKDQGQKYFHLSTELFSDFNITVNDLTVVYQLPPGSKFVSQDYISDSTTIAYSMKTQTARNHFSAFKHIELVFRGSDIQYVDNNDFTITYQYNGLGHFQYFATFLAVSFVILAFFLAISNVKIRPSKSIEIERELIPIAEIDKFFTLFDNRESAENRISELRSRRQKNKISKKEYEEGIKTIRKRIRDINPQLESAAEVLASKGGKYENLVTKLMVASQRKTMVRRNLKTLKRDYESGNLTKMVYQRSIREATQDLNKQNSTINKILAEMSELVQKYNL